MKIKKKYSIFYLKKNLKNFFLKIKPRKKEIFKKLIK